MSVPIDSQHARRALLCLDACNLSGVTLEAHNISVEVTRAHASTGAVLDYPPLILLLAKASELAGAATIVSGYQAFETWSRAYHACTEVANGTLAR